MAGILPRRFARRGALLRRPRSSGRFLPRDVLLTAAAIVYLVWPVDLVPDALLVAGLVDDALVLFLALRRLRGRRAGDRPSEPAGAVP